MKVLVIGGGVAGASVAYFAGRAGHDVTLVDAGVGRASDVPSALVNPVRGQSGRVDPGALEGMRLTWALAEDLGAAHGKTGVWRPVPDERVRAKFEASLPPDLPYAWRDPSDVPGLAPGWHSVLELPEGGWLDGPSFVAALVRASGAKVVRAVVNDPGEFGADVDIVVRCGGSFSGEGVHRRGTLLLLDRPPAPVPLSFGVYAAPHGVGGVLGSTFEAPANGYEDAGPPLASLSWLLDKARGLLSDTSANVVGSWTGSRLSALRCGALHDGTYVLSGLGSKGFLLGPLLARNLTASWMRDG